MRPLKARSPLRLFVFFFLIWLHLGAATAAVVGDLIRFQLVARCDRVLVDDRQDDSTGLVLDGLMVGHQSSRC